MNLEEHLLDTLRTKGSKAGLTVGEIRKKCGMAWRKAAGSRKQTECTAGEVRDLVHQLWKSGKVVVEPPTGKSQAVRVWHPECANRKFGLEPASASNFNPGQAREDYKKLARETRSPYVFISALVKRSKCRTEDLHDYLVEQESRGQAVLSTGDWSSATEEEKQAALETGGRRFIKVRLP
tara:strand:- start:4599 stop:5138 length:540 start_codon:yes stop_codon:yes gene_type:complete